MFYNRLMVSEMSEKINNNQEIRKTTIGGQALIEGLMMIGPEKKAMAVRNPEGEIELEFIKGKSTSKIEKIPFLRGPVRLFKQLIVGTKAMMRSADIAEADEIKDKEKKKESQLTIYISVIVSLLFSVFLFMLVPGVIVDLISSLLGVAVDSKASSLMLTLAEGLVRVIIFILYLWLVSKMDDIKRVWQYHGSEHKTIACYEAKMPLTVENIRTFSRFHPRCGTSFMFLVMIVSIIVLAFIGWHSRIVNLIIRLLLLPVIAGVTYEIIRLVGRYDNVLTRMISRPGLAMQRLTTAEPDDSMIEVAIVAMEAVIPDVEGSDEW